MWVLIPVCSSQPSWADEHHWAPGSPHACTPQPGLGFYMFICFFVTLIRKIWWVEGFPCSAPWRWEQSWTGYWAVGMAPQGGGWQHDTLCQRHRWCQPMSPCPLTWPAVSRGRAMLPHSHSAELSHCLSCCSSCCSVSLQHLQTPQMKFTAPCPAPCAPK